MQHMFFQNEMVGVLELYHIEIRLYPARILSPIKIKTKLLLDNEM
jgi:hypothetical protein